MTIRVGIVDDHPHARKAIRHILEQDSRYLIAGEARSGEDAIVQLSEWDVHLLLMDLRLPGMNGVQAMKQMKKTFPYIKMIVISVSDDATDLYEAILAGAQGYLIKNISVDSWLRYINAVVFEDEDLPEQFTRRLVNAFQAQVVDEQAMDELESKLQKLTERERHVVSELSKGYTNRELAEKLFISEHTIKNHLKNIMQKLHVTNRVQLVKLGEYITRSRH